VTDFTELHEWHEFYFLMGTAVAAFIALLFVAISVSAGHFSDRHAAGIRTFFSPVVLHYSAILVCSAVALAPEKTPLILFSVCTGLVALIGLTAGCVTMARVFQSTGGDSGVVLIDHFAYGAMPAAIYAVLIVSSVFLAMQRHWPLAVIAGALLALMLVNIRNAWDLMLAMIRRYGQEH
jgi:hypothetical protein